jgi:dimethylaniline monooxygenase (N-oxide forming)
MSRTKQRMQSLRGRKKAKLEINGNKGKNTIVIIGAGPSGLVTLKTLIENNYNAIILEASSKIGGTFANKSYDNGSLVSSKYITPFSDFRWEDASDNHPPIPEYLKYLDCYCKKFDLHKFIYFGVKVSKINRHRNKGNSNCKVRYSVKCEYPKSVYNHSNLKSYLSMTKFDGVAVCSGLHNVPYIPTIKGLENFQGEILHSSQYKERSVFKGKKVLIVGCGETAMDLAYRAVITSTKQVSLVVRNGFLSVPTVLTEDIALDTYITNLFECCYQHRWTEYLKLKWNFTGPFIRGAFYFGTGSAGGYNQWAGTLPNVYRGYHIINKSVAAMPYINPQIKKKSWFGRNVYGIFDRSNKDPDSKIINIKNEINYIEKNGTTVHFKNGEYEDFDFIVFCTGYRQKFPFIYDGDAYGKGDDPLPSEHLICNKSEDTLAFIGFVRPNVGAIPPMSEMQVMWWIEMKLNHTLRKAPKKRNNNNCNNIISYELLGRNPRTCRYGVDYGAYMHDLARDINAAPDLLFTWWWKSPKTAIAYALGQSYVTFFRLEGPFKFDQAVDISENELYAPVVRRGLVGNCIFVVVIVIFGVINLLFWVLDHAFVSPINLLRAVAVSS